eukprot:3988166-Amphidinium_carterae.2
MGTSCEALYCGVETEKDSAADILHIQRLYLHVCMFSIIGVVNVHMVSTDRCMSLLTRKMTWPPRWLARAYHLRCCWSCMRSQQGWQDTYDTINNNGIRYASKGV